MKFNEIIHQNVESEFYEVKKNGQIFCIGITFEYNEHNFLVYQ